MYITTIGEIEDMVGKRADQVIVHDSEIICIFSGGIMADGHIGGDFRFHIKRW